MLLQELGDDVGAKVYETPRSFSAHPEMSASDQTTGVAQEARIWHAVGRMMRLICSAGCVRPVAWMQKIFSSTAAKNSTLNTSWNFFHSLMLNRRLHSS